MLAVGVDRMGLYGTGMVVVIDGGCQIVPASVRQVRPCACQQPVGVGSFRSVTTADGVGEGSPLGNTQPVEEGMVIVVVHLEQLPVRSLVECVVGVADA